MTVAAAPRPRDRKEIPDQYKWNLTDIFPSWEAWSDAFKTLDEGIGKFEALKGTIRQGADQLLRAYQLSDQLGQLAYRVWYYPSLQYDEDQRDNAVNAKRQEVQILFARLQQAQSWFNPELLQIPLETVRGWLERSAGIVDGDVEHAAFRRFGCIHVLPVPVSHWNTRRRALRHVDAGCADDGLLRAPRLWNAWRGWLFRGIARSEGTQ